MRPIWTQVWNVMRLKRTGLLNQLSEIWSFTDESASFLFKCKASEGESVGALHELWLQQNLQLKVITFSLKLSNFQGRSYLLHTKLIKFSTRLALNFRQWRNYDRGTVLSCSSNGFRYKYCVLISQSIIHVICCRKSSILSWC